MLHAAIAETMWKRQVSLKGCLPLHRGRDSASSLMHRAERTDPQ